MKRLGPLRTLGAVAVPAPAAPTSTAPAAIAFPAKGDFRVLLLTRKGLPGWAIPVAGGLGLTGLTGIWLTSALWFFQNNGIIF